MIYTPFELNKRQVEISGDPSEISLAETMIFIDTALDLWREVQSVRGADDTLDYELEGLYYDNEKLRDNVLALLTEQSRLRDEVERLQSENWLLRSIDNLES